MMRNFVSATIPPVDRTEPAYWFAFAGNRLLCYEAAAEVVPLLGDVAELGLEAVRQQYLGTFNGRHCFSVELPAQIEAPAGMALKGLREVYERLGEEFFAIAGRAVQIVDWDRTHQFCGQCGARMESLEREKAKRCPQCQLVNYPRLSPSIIVAVRRGDALLLARSPRFPPGMYSVLAGFVEPGETLEQAVEREVLEEVGLAIKNIRYFGSQPWPFPNSLMIGYTAEYANGEFELDPVEIEDAGWFTAANLPAIPGRLSIARRLIDDFIRDTTEEIKV
jgi:NAD+ diphosphatase